MSTLSASRGPLFLNIGLTIVGVVITVLSLKLGFGTLKKPGAGLFPFLCGLIIFVESLVLIFFKGKTSDADASPSSYERKHLLSMAAIFILWIILMPWLGYIVVTFLAAFSFSKAIGLEGWRKPILLAAGITGFCYLLFDVYLYVDLPRGFLG
jgi:putative tricarboxylic transport membrane protein